MKLLTTAMNVERKEGIWEDFCQFSTKDEERQVTWNIRIGGVRCLRLNIVSTKTK